MGRVRAVLEQAHDEHLGGRFDVSPHASKHMRTHPTTLTRSHPPRWPQVFLSHAWGMGDARKPFTDALCVLFAAARPTDRTCAVLPFPRLC